MRLKQILVQQLAWYKFCTIEFKFFSVKKFQFRTHCLRIIHYMKKMRGLSWQWNQALMTKRHQGQLKKYESWEPVWSYQLNSIANSAHLPHFWVCSCGVRTPYGVLLSKCHSSTFQNFSIFGHGSTCLDKFWPI